MSLSNLTVSRRQVVGLGLGLATTLGLVACGSSESSDASGSSSTDSSTDATEDTEDETVQIDSSAYDALIATGSVADDAAISASTWATKVKDAGTMRVGGVQTSMLFSLLDETDGKLRGFDAGLAQLLARYVLGDESKIENTQVTSDTRESVLQNDQVDTVFATYSISDKRKEVISFAGPYYTTQQSILVNVDNTDINSVDDLAGKNVAAQSGSTGPSILEELAPDATIQEFKTDEEARAALSQGRVDAYVIDTNMQLGSMVRNPGKYRLAGDPFGPVDAYGIGLPLDSDGVDFVNVFLHKVEDEGLWEDLWKICIGNRAGIEDVPEPPAIGA
ncbi:glutamate ABC transporter substrate-binding protein [Thermophilibacter immobilis]|jgi:glutamate transport system substrate-binding protein|uniref:Glutamate ABC transporter substrate-binding protein n=1 Tax=Thermophilibacter immobilis TaxID=2779519 RepID=A0A7S7M7N2_9ACTN|nr:glutamate ABC transporter substrate-binding protein [Thermophilibacter immobilis]QOY59932.1 glutamate ABC transporter substrate-binding protein [Thermophilibacter immobilis]